MKLIDIATNLGSNESAEVNIFIKDFDGFEWKKKYTISDKKNIVVRLPLKDGLYSISNKCEIYIAAINHSNHKIYERTVLNDITKTISNVSIQWTDFNVSFQDSYDIVQDNDLDKINYSVNVKNPHKYFDSFMPTSTEIKINDSWVKFTGLKQLAVGTYKYDVRVSNQNHMTWEKIITVNVKAKEEKPLPKVQKIKFNYAFFTPMNNVHMKPSIPIVCYVSPNLDVKKVEFFYNGNSIQSQTNIEEIKALNVVKLPSYTDIDINAKFTCIDKTTKEQVVLEDTKTFNISSQLMLSLYHNYDDSKKVFRIGLSASKDDMAKVDKILFSIRFTSVVMENVLNVADYSAEMISDVVFEHQIDPDNPEIEVDFKSVSNYNITAYVYDKAGNIHILKDQIKQLSSESSGNNYTINQKIPVIIKNNSETTPVYDLYCLTSKGLKKINTYITNKLFGNLYSSEFTTKFNDSVYVVKIGDSLKTFYVGNSNNMVVLRVKNANDLPDYVFKDYDGNKIAEGKVTLSNEDNSIGYIILPEGKNGILKIAGYIYKKIG